MMKNQCNAKNQISFQRFFKIKPDTEWISLIATRRLGLRGSLCLGPARLVIMREETVKVWVGRGVELTAHGADD